MHPLLSPLVLRLRCFALAGAGLALLPGGHAQTAPASPARVKSPSAADLAKYDRNKNGVLEADEAAALEAEGGSGPIVMNPFQVSTEKDQGYIAANSLAGGRANTPLKLTPASISVMTQEFMQDFNVTNLTQAINWTVNVEMRTQSSLDSNPFGQFEVNFRGAGGSNGIPTRNYFRFYFNSDSYNTERMEFSRGPNSLLFGDTNVGGIAGQLTKQPRFDSRIVGTTFRVDSFGGIRATGDFGYGADRFAVRVNTVVQRLKPYANGTYTDNEGIHFTTAYKLLPKTVVRLEGEWNQTRTTNYQRTYQENASYWNRTTFNDNNTVIPDATALAAGIEPISTTNTYLVYNLSQPQNGVQNYVGTQYRSRGTGFRIPWEGRTDIPNFARVPSKDFNLGPADSRQERTLNTWSAYLDHSFSDNWAAQLAYQRVVYGPITPITESTAGEYRIDVNRLLPNGAANPDVGKPYAEIVQSHQYQENAQDDIRVLTSFKFGVPVLFGRNIDMKQRFSVIAGYRYDRYEMGQWSTRWVNNPLVPNPTDARNQVRFRVYWDRPLPEITDRPPSMPGAIFADVMTGNPTRNQRQLRYGQIASTTTFFNDRLSIIAGVRHDTLKIDNIQGIGQDPITGKYILGNYDPAIKANRAGYHTDYRPKATKPNYGAVLYVLPWLGLVANYSENFAVPTSGPNKIDKTPFDPPEGKGKDFGLRFSLMEGRVYATASYYDTTQLNAILGEANQTEIRRIWTNLGYTDTDRTNLTYRDNESFQNKGFEFEVTANLTRNLRFTLNHARPKRNLISQRPGLQAYLAENLAEWQAGAAAAAGTVVNGRTIQNPATIAQDIQRVQDTVNGVAPGVLANDLLKHSTNIAAAYSFREGRLKGFTFGGGAQLRGPRKVGSRDAQIKFNTTTPTVAQNVAAAYDYLYAPSSQTYTAFAAYDFRLNQKIRARVQLNIDNLLDDDSPQWRSYGVVAANAFGNGNPRMQLLSNFEQFDPRMFSLTSTFSF